MRYYEDEDGDVVVTRVSLVPTVKGWHNKFLHVCSICVPRGPHSAVAPLQRSTCHESFALALTSVSQPATIDLETGAGKLQGVSRT